MARQLLRSSFTLAAAAPSRNRITCVLIAGIALTLARAGAANAVGFQDVAERARALAGKPYAVVSAPLPQELNTLGYDRYRDIRFDPKKASWRDQALPFELQFFHRANRHTQQVAIDEIAGGSVRPIVFHAQDFDYGTTGLSPQRWGDLGFAGFRVHYALNTPSYKDELVAFLDASYFRALGRGQRYGLSARGLAIDTLAPKGEEFPRFVEFWVQRPARDARSLVIYALLDSPRATGAYRFTFQPGEDTVVDVQARLYLRDAVGTLGVAPLTSMYVHGANQPRAGDFRPQVHDSDGLMIAIGDGAGGAEWLWRPLVNPAQPLVTSFAAPELRGFGLMQRERRFASYEDTEARYELRPSCWIAPQSRWGPGRVELVQLPAPNEASDNIVAYWVPERMPKPGEPLNVAYRMHWQGDRQQHPPTGWTVQTRLGHGPATGRGDPRELQYIVDFDGPALRALPNRAAVAAVVSSSANATVVEGNAYHNDATGTWRMTVRLNRLQASQPVELRAFLRHGNTALTETWTMIIPSG
jgi:periplasmic glucans biosynthesis protein